MASQTEAGIRQWPAQQEILLTLMGLVAAGAITLTEGGVQTKETLLFNNIIMAGKTQFFLFFPQKESLLGFMRIMALQAMTGGGGRVGDNPGGISLAVMAIKTENCIRLHQQGGFFRRVAPVAGETVAFGYGLMPVSTFRRDNGIPVMTG
jgi:hypothetical protein